MASGEQESDHPKSAAPECGKSMATGGDKEQVEKPSMIGNYELGRLLGEGAFSKVKLGTHASTKAKVAVKIVDKDSINNIKDLERVMREMHVLKNIKHPNIIQLHEVVELGPKIYMVIDFADGGELNDYIEAKGAVPEREARTWFSQIMSGVDFFHRQHVSHRDLKPENILMVAQGSALVCKIADFGLSNDMVPGEMLKTICGTPAFAAPEVTLSQKYDGAAVDVWSLGAILFTMVAGTIPFEANSQPELFRRIQQGIYSVPVHCSPELADMVRRFLEVSPQKRATIAQAWQHPWLSAANNRFLELEDLMGNEALEQEVKAVALEGAPDTADKGAARPEEASEAEEVLELLPCNALPPSMLDTLARDHDSAAGLTVTVMVPLDDSAAGADSTAPASGAQQRYTLLTAPKPDKDKPASAEAAVAPARKASVGGSTGPSTPTSRGGPGTPTARARAISDSFAGLQGKSPPGGGLRTSPLGCGSPLAMSSPSARSMPIKVPGVLGRRDSAMPGSPGLSSVSPGSSPPAAVIGSASLSVGMSAMRVRRRSISVGSSSLGATGAATVSTTTANAATKDPSETNLATIVAKEPKVVLKELQKLFADLKVLLRSVNASSVKGEKNRVRFAVWVYKVTAVQNAAVDADLYLVGTSRMSGDHVTCRDICRRLLLKI